MCVYGLGRDGGVYAAHACMAAYMHACMHKCNNLHLRQSFLNAQNSSLSLERCDSVAALGVSLCSSSCGCKNFLIANNRLPPRNSAVSRQPAPRFSGGRAPWRNFLYSTSEDFLLFAVVAETFPRSIHGEQHRGK